MYVASVGSALLTGNGSGAASRALLEQSRNAMHFCHCWVRGLTAARALLGGGSLYPCCIPGPAPELLSPLHPPPLGKALWEWGLAIGIPAHILSGDPRFNNENTRLTPGPEFDYCCRLTKCTPHFRQPCSAGRLRCFPP